MVRLKQWQWIVLATPIVLVVGFLLVAAGTQIHEWRLNWIWAVFTLLLVGWRWLLVRWTQPAIKQIEEAISQANAEIEALTDANQPVAGDAARRTETALETILMAAQADPPLWEDWSIFWRRCKEVVTAVAHIYHPEVKYPLLNIYIPQAYGLIRGTVDDMDLWMQKLSPVLNQVTVGQGYQAYEVYRQLEPSARKLWQVWNWAQWVFNPAAAAARQASQRYSDQANQQLLVNLGQSLREAALRNLGRQATLLYSGTLPSLTSAPPTLTNPQTQTLREILTQAEPVETVEQQPVSILLVGRTGAGKSSVINTLFEADLAAVDVLPSTDQIQSYQWQTATGESLTLWDTPGYEQVDRENFRQQVLEYAATADLLLLVTPALDPALQMDADFLRDIKTDLSNLSDLSDLSDLPVIAIVTQVDRLRPVREWQPPYDWQWGNRPKEVAIREATQYRAQALGEYCDRVLPLVTSDSQSGRAAWGADVLSLALVEAIAPAKQIRLARFLRDLDARSVAASKIIDHYRFQMTTTQGLTALLKSPVLAFISTLATGSPTLAYVLAEKIPVEQLPLVIGRLQMAYDLFSLLKPDRAFDLNALWPLLLDTSAPPDRSATALGQSLTEYWTQNLSTEQLQTRYQGYLQ
ncbi:GTPase family protein [Leptolyngbya sp. NK1-12]|uniref:GTPase family protein n=1 Tax=Leptolyngbya sp. NK1-12 TaxID=2547451 RepID=A0AA96WGU1_9CYAN|nr:GTPase family protein [Leptolyngbya sp. NK1-12]WNZ24819.1 GTPase family protein [Leptolyngbya sp. NK1-12]